MSKVMVHQAEGGKAAVMNPFFGKVEQACDAVRHRAYELCERRGGEPGREIEDWLEAERELFFVPDAEMSESDQAFSVKIAIPGFLARDIEVIALPRELVVEAKSDKLAENASESKRLYRRFELSSPIEAEKVTATATGGELRIEAPKKMEQQVLARAATA